MCGLVGIRLVEGQGTPHSVPYPGVRRRRCRFGVSLRAWVGAWCPHSSGQPGRQGWQQQPAAWGLPSLRASPEEEGAEWEAGTGRGRADPRTGCHRGHLADGAGPAGVGPGRFSHQPGLPPPSGLRCVSFDTLGVLRRPKAGIPNWRTELESSGCPSSTMLVAMWSSIRIFFQSPALL